MKLSLVVALAFASAVKAQDLSQVKFFLWTRENPVVADDINFNLVGLGQSHYNPSKQTYVTIHGWNSDIDFTTDEFRRELLDNNDCNVIGIDWSALESWTNYIAAAKTCMIVGTHVGEFVADLIDTTGLRHNLVHVIGHSLGAQAAGHTGRTVNQITGSRIGRITGLDPAKPYFDVIDASLRLGKNDASFVDIVHTNSGDLVNGCLSFMDQMGHIDFYPGGGEHQPGCTEICTSDCTEADLIDLIKGGCSHSRANSYFAESINRGRFTGTMCNSWGAYVGGLCGGGAKQAMGFPCNSSPGEGMYFLNVNQQSPFSQG